MDQTATYVFAGGGTGGHLFPGIATAEEILARDRRARIVFAGSEREIDRRVSRQLGFEHHVLPAESTATARRHPLRFVWRNWRALRIAKAMLRREKPAAVVGLGGFASVPVVVAAMRLKLPTLLLEQNVLPGKATRWLSRKATMVCLAFEQTRAYLPESSRLSVSGNPVRNHIADLQSRSMNDQRSRMLLVLGGSQGALALNEAMLRVAELLRPDLGGWKIVHQTGRQHVDLVRTRYAQLGIDCVVEPFFNELGAWYRQAGLVVSRAGATTLAELACAGLPAVLVPYPHAASDHQWHNARVFADADAARIVQQSANVSATAENLAGQLQGLLSNQSHRERMAMAMKSLARPRAAEMVVDELFALADEKAANCRPQRNAPVHLRAS